MRISIENEQDGIEFGPAEEKLIRQAVGFCIEEEGFTESAGVDILLVDDREIRQINREHRQIDAPTDVLSFPMLDIKDGKPVLSAGDYDMDDQTLLLGDIVISLETADRQSGEYGHSLRRELCFLVTHGMFHLLGYDHEEPEEEKRMLQKQEKVLSAMGQRRGTRSTGSGVKP